MNDHTQEERPFWWEDLNLSVCNKLGSLSVMEIQSTNARSVVSRRKENIRGNRQNMNHCQEKVEKCKQATFNVFSVQL